VIPWLPARPNGNGTKIKTGVMGGTFDPVHLGHLAVAEEARQQVGLEEVIFVPAGHPYFKALARISSSQHRINMLNLALVGKPYFRVSLLEIERPGPSYAVDTLARLRERLNPQDELYFILGWDSLLTLPRWEQPERLIELCQLIAAPRPGFSRPDVNLLESELPGVSRRTMVMDQPVIDISSSDIRERVKQGQAVDHLVVPAVAQYIKENGLYQNR
jgi:nicotinate-nucleotide adenylyltransferase